MFRCKDASCALLECQKAAQVVFISYVCKRKLVSCMTTMNLKKQSVSEGLYLYQVLVFPFCPLTDSLDLATFFSFFLSALCWISWSS